MGRIYLSFLLLFLFSNTASSKAIVVHSSDSQSILEYSNVIMDNGELPIQEIIRQNKLVPYKHKYINARMSQDNIWIEFSLKNTSKTVVDKVLVLSSPLLEHITLFQHAQWDKGITKGHAHTSDNHKTIFHHFHLSLEPESEQTYYLKVQSDHTPVDFAVTLENPKEFYSNDLKQQYITLVLAGVILALMFYSFILSFFIKDRSYFYYGLYLFALLYQQITYLGLTQIFFPEWFILFDMRISIGKVTFLIMTSALFAMHFLKIESHKTFYSIYKLFIVVTLIEMLFSVPVLHTICIL